MFGSIITLSDYAYAMYCLLCPSPLNSSYMLWATVLNETRLTKAGRKSAYCRAVEPEQAIKYR